MLYNLLYLSPSLFVLVTTRDSRHTSVVRRLTQREFCRQSVVSLCHSIPVRPAATQHHADNTLERLHVHHYLEMGKKRRDCCVCSCHGPGEENTSQTQFLAHAQTTLPSASIHASGLTICKPFSNYCPLKHAVSYV